MDYWKFYNRCDFVMWNYILRILFYRHAEKEHPDSKALMVWLTEPFDYQINDDEIGNLPSDLSIDDCVHSQLAKVGALSTDLNPATSCHFCIPKWYASILIYRGSFSFCLDNELPDAFTNAPNKSFGISFMEKTGGYGEWAKENGKLSGENENKTAVKSNKTNSSVEVVESVQWSYIVVRGRRDAISMKIISDSVLILFVCCSNNPIDDSIVLLFLRSFFSCDIATTTLTKHN